jgi:hypothetical protein
MPLQACLCPDNPLTGAAFHTRDLGWYREKSDTASGGGFARLFPVEVKPEKENKDGIA